MEHYLKAIEKQCERCYLSYQFSFNLDDVNKDIARLKKANKENFELNLISKSEMLEADGIINKFDKEIKKLDTNGAVCL